MDNARLISERNLWLATVRPSGKPHLIPIWFVWLHERIYMGTQPDSVKVRNVRREPRVSIALEDGVVPVIGEGVARLLEPPFDAGVLAAFKAKYDWDIGADPATHVLIEVAIDRWLTW